MYLYFEKESIKNLKSLKMVVWVDSDWLHRLHKLKLVSLLINKRT